MANIQSNFAIAIIGMVIVCIVLMGFPITFILAKGLQNKKKN
jgi:hypothetical protein